MTPLSLTLLGPFQAQNNGRPVPGFRTKATQALLIYLAVQPKQAQGREKLMTLLWPRMPQKSAQANLRQTLYQLRQAIPEVKASSGTSDQAVELVIANRREIQLNPAADVDTDVVRFETLLARTSAHQHLDLTVCGDCRQDLEQAVAIYQDHFLIDFFLEDSNEFEDWAQSRRELYRRKVLDALEILTTISFRQEAYAEGQAYAERQLEIDNLRESAYRQLMELLAFSGRRREATVVYERCRRFLLEELGMEPAARTSELYAQILAGDVTLQPSVAQGVRGFELREEIGEGAYGVIHRAFQPSVGREVAVKVIRRKYANDPEFIRRFEAEAQTVARLEHPFIVPLYDYWRDPEGAYLVMRYVREGSLESALKAGPWEPERAIRMVDQIASALAATHQQGVVHRDLKPANILLDGAGNAYLTDFGIAKDLTGEARFTVEGTIVGTLDYVSPEQIKSERVTPQTDIYSFGAVVYETLTGEKPFTDTSVANLIYSHLNQPIPQVSASRPDLPPGVDDVLQRATAKRPADRFENVPELAGAFRQAFAPLQGPDLVSMVPEAPAVTELYNPYKGLRAFQEADVDDFFGRDALIEQLVARLTPASALSLAGGGSVGAGRFLALVGPSGSGKSSAVKAGLIPALRAGAVSGSDKWFVAEMAPGTHPLDELELALLPIAVDPPPSLVQPMERDLHGLLRTVRRILPTEDVSSGDTAGEGAQLLLVIDQFEELFTLVTDVERRSFFLDSLLAALNAPRSPLRLVITLRADFYDRPLQHPHWGQLLKENTEVILPLSQAELSWSVREPSRRMGVTLEGALAETIVADVADQPGSLPLLQYALTELFEKRQDRLMTQDAYEEIGGVLGALGRRAEALYAGLEEPGQEAARQLFLRLVTLGENVEDTRRRVLRSELQALEENEDAGVGSRLELDVVDELAHNEMDEVIDGFGQGRLLTFDRDPLTREPTVEVAHEALLREWSRLRGWLDESRNDVRMQRMLAEAAAEWQEASGDDSYLLRGSRLEQFAGWAALSTVALTRDEQAYLDAALDARLAREAEEEARRRRELETAQQLAETEKARAEEQSASAGRLRRRAVILTGALVVAAVLAVAAFFFARQSNENAAAAEANAALASTRETEALLEAKQRATAQAQIEEERQRADEQRDVALAAEAEALQEREIAEEQALLARSRELAAASTNSQAVDPELSLLLATEALSAADTIEAQNALHAAVLGSRIRQRLNAHVEVIDSVAYSPNGSLIAMSSVDSTASVWNATTGEQVFAVPINTFGGTDSFLPVNLNLDGTLLAVVDPGDELVLSFWDTVTGRRLEEISLPIPTAGITRYHLNPDWTQLAVGYEDGSAAIWDLVNGELVAEPSDHADYVEPYYSPDGRFLATVGDGMILVWDVATAALIRRLDIGGPAFFVSMSPNGRWLAYGDIDSAVQIWDLEAPDSGAGQEPFATLTGHGNYVFGQAFSPDSQLIASASRDGTSRLWDISTGEELLVLPHGNNLAAVAFHPDGGSLLTGDLNGVARVWDISPQGAAERLALEVHSSFVRGASLSPDGHTLATASDDGTAKIWDVATGQELQLLDGHLGGRVMDVAFHPGGRSLATAGNDGKARVWDTATGQESFSINGHGEGIVGGSFTGVLSLDYSPDGNRLATAGADGAARIWDGDTGEALLTLEGHTAGLTNVRFSPDGRFLATGSERPDVTVRIWDAETGQELFALPPSHGDRVWGLDFSPDGRFLATSGGDTTAKIWRLDYNANNGELLATLTAHSNTVGTVHFAPDGKSLATATSQEVRLWDVSTLSGDSEEKVVPELLNLAGGWATVFNMDANELITGDRSGLLRVYLLDLAELMELARSRLTRTWTAEECRQFRIEPCPAES
jgi:WD40 repeat protein/DNA-binding SARP family transcriptional activator/tRNA A-37 threonylcarbamoyl transferase component Bud32